MRSESKVRPFGVHAARNGVPRKRSRERAPVVGDRFGVEASTAEVDVEDPKDGELYVVTMKSVETLMEVGRRFDVQIDVPNCV